MITGVFVIKAAIVIATSTATNSLVAKLASASPGQNNVLLTTILYAAVITKRIQTHVRPPLKGGRPSSSTANVVVIVTGVRAIATTVVKAMSTATFQTELVDEMGYASQFLLDRTAMALQMIKCAVVMTSSTRIHAKPIKAGRVFKIWATASMRILLLSESLASIMTGA